MIKLKNCHFSTHGEKNSFKLRLSVDAKAIWGKANGEMYVYVSPEYLSFVHKWHTGHSWETQLYSVG